MSMYAQHPSTPPQLPSAAVPLAPLDIAGPASEHVGAKFFRLAMGFTTGFLGGVTLTSAVLYLTISMHTQSRMQQAALLRQQRQVLTDFYEPKKPQPEPKPRVVPVGLLDMAKDRWNRSLEEGVRRIYTTDWRKVREEAEDRAASLAERIRQHTK
ncbi:hypothetical protein ACEQ8H_001940 [Pleosporales sp. CAS-2024a]